jgi:hypothetical protein
LQSKSSVPDWDPKTEGLVPELNSANTAADFSTLLNRSLESDAAFAAPPALSSDPLDLSIQPGSVAKRQNPAPVIRPTPHQPSTSSLVSADLIEMAGRLLVSAEIPAKLNKNTAMIDAHKNFPSAPFGQLNPRSYQTYSARTSLANGLIAVNEPRHIEINSRQPILAVPSNAEQAYVPKTLTSSSTTPDHQISGVLDRSSSFDLQVGPGVPAQLVSGGAADDVGVLISRKEVTAFEIMLTPTAQTDGQHQQHSADAVNAGLEWSDEPTLPSLLPQTELSYHARPAFTGSTSETSDSKISADGSPTRQGTGTASLGFGELPRILTLRSTEAVALRSGLDRVGSDSNDPIIAAATTGNQSSPALTSESRASSSQPIVPMESNEMTVPSPPKAELSVRIQGESGQIVNVRIAERAGQVQVLVRASDPATAAMLRRDLPTMRTSLEQIGWHLGSLSNFPDQIGGAHHNDAQSHAQGEHHGQDQAPEQWQQEQNRRHPGPGDQWLELMNREM